MPRTRTAPTPAKETKIHRSTRTTARKPVRVASVSGAGTDAGPLNDLIAAVAYRNWQERGDTPGSPEEDWLKAEIEVLGTNAL